MKHVVMMSGGAGSWATARRVVETRVQSDDTLTLVFADTLIEDEDLYRFLEEATADVIAAVPDGASGEFVRLADGRTPWEVFFDVRFLGNSRIDPCSKILKRDLIRRWVEETCDPAGTVVYLGIDWSEDHRFEKSKPYWRPYTVEAPLCDPPYVDKEEILDQLRAKGIEPPRLYAMGFPHNNCGGFCVKSGNAAFRLLLEKMPERYAQHEAQEERFRAHTGKDVAIIRDRGRKIIMRRLGLTDGDVEKIGDAWQVKATGEPLPKVLPLTLREFRERLESDPTFEVDPYDLGGCACFTPDAYEDDTPAAPTAVDLGLPAFPRKDVSA